MKQHLETVSSSGASDFEVTVNKLLGEGYVVKSTCISRREVGSYDEYSVFQAILVKETE